MTKLESIETLVSKIPCPVCLNSRFEVNLNCDLPKSPCDFHAVCGHCHNKIVVTPYTKTMNDLWSQVEKHIIKTGCPECGDHKLSLEFLCDIQSEDCFFLVRCEDNSHYSRIDQKGIKFLFQ